MNSGIQSSDNLLSALSDQEPVQAIESLSACQSPLLIGVRHHSAAMAKSLNTLLDRFAPKALLVELPVDFSDWTAFLSDVDTKPPVAISAASSNGDLAFYPLADFSPELIAIRWAHRKGIPVIPCDLSVSARFSDSEIDKVYPSRSGSEDNSILKEVLRKTQSLDVGQLWERLVETPSMAVDPETIRRAGLLFGWLIRKSAAQISIRDQIREAVMRESIRKAPARAVAVVGAFHAPALTPDVCLNFQESDERILSCIAVDPKSVGVSLIPYSFEQFDERSGYPAGIKDPIWHQFMFESTSLEQADSFTVKLVVDICRTLRQRGHVAGTPDATEIVRMMRDLARLRKLPMAGRSELLEAIESCLVQGERNGRAIEVAKAVEKNLIGRRYGSVSSRVPRCGLALAIDETLQVLSLPNSTDGIVPSTKEKKEIRLDVLRSPRDRAKAVVLRQLSILGIPYGDRFDSGSIGDRENLGERWQVGWSQGTSATIESVSRFGVTLPQAVAGAIRNRVQNNSALSGSANELLPKELLAQLELASEAGIRQLVYSGIAELTGNFLVAAGFEDVVRALTLLARITAGHLPALPLKIDDSFPPIVDLFYTTSFDKTPETLLAVTLQRLNGLTGSNDSADIENIGDLAHWLHDNPDYAPDGLLSWCRRALEIGSSGMRGVAAGVLAMFREMSQDQIASLVGGWFDQASNKDGRANLRARIFGLVQILFPLALSDSEWLRGLEDRLKSSSDQDFLIRLPSLRGAFHEFSVADRHRLLRTRLELYSERGQLTRSDRLLESTITDTALWSAILRDSDLQGRAAIEEIFPDFPFGVANTVPSPLHELIANTPAMSIQRSSTATPSAIPIADRWRMILGVTPETPSASRAANRLDELYGQGKGEGSRGGIGRRDPTSKSGGSDEAASPSRIELSDDLEQLFGSDVCQEVLGDAVGRGNLAAISSLDPDRITPSIDLLRQVLTLAGGLPEHRSERLRKLAKRVTEALTKQLAVRLQPAFSGLSSPRPTRRRGRKLHLRRTIQDNLSNVYRRIGKNPGVIPKKLIFQSVSRREMDWHLTFVVDVSGSMTASVVYSAICAAIFAELPAITVKFLAFSTEVIDLSDKVVDPLSLLLEVQVGGGTRIGLGLSAARGRIKVPQRTILVLVSDFEEGVSIGEMLGEVRELVGAGVRCLGLASLDDSGVARFHQGNANLVAAAGMSVAAVAPEHLARWVGDQIRGVAQNSIPALPKEAL